MDAFNIQRIITEPFEWEVTFKDHPSPTPLQWAEPWAVRPGAQSPILPDLEHLRNTHPTTSPWNLSQCFATLTIRMFFIISSLDLPSFSLKRFSFVLSQQTLIRSLFSSFFQPPFRYWKNTIRSPQSIINVYWFGRHKKVTESIHLTFNQLLLKHYFLQLVK